ncbi:MAG TPA: peptide-methionine (S)-S-oxide reductase MsrA [Vicinamibacteria bacterium]|nr:peptide-methionine (S)-S-oxide reductase MsrA [Vicinamibacteria bacterium]
MRMRLGVMTALAVAVGVALVVGRGSVTGAAGKKAAMPAVPAGAAIATFAGGCFWCMEPPFEKVPGVYSVTSGYTGGDQQDPSYEQVGSGGTGHAEAVRIVFDPSKVGYEKLLEVFWRNVDPTVRNRQFCDVGEQYRSAIYVHDAGQRKAAEASKAEVERTKRFPQPIVTPIEDAGPFWPAEEYHQDYYKKNPMQYRMYRTGCGRDARLKELWGSSDH